MKASTWNEHVFGNHRAIVEVERKCDAIRVHVPWRRRDPNPQDKNVVVIDAAANVRVLNTVVADISRASGDIVFQPMTAPGTYHVYFMPFTGSVRAHYPQCAYLPPEATAQPAWLERNKLTPDELKAGSWMVLPDARFAGFQTIDDFSAFGPMETSATKAETDGLLELHPAAPFLLFAEDREHPIRMTDCLPKRWIERGAFTPVRGAAQRGEFYAFQIGLFAARGPVRNVQLSFAALTSKTTISVVPPGSFRCINLGGTDWTGKTIAKSVSVDAGAVQPLWCGVQLPTTIGPGEYSTSISVSADGMKPQTATLILTVSTKAAPAAGDDDPFRLSRLRWLDSTLALDDELVKPFTAVEAAGTTFNVLGRRIVAGPGGLPAQILSFFAPEVTHLVSRGREILARPMRLVVEDDHSRLVRFQAGQPKITHQAPGAASWEAHSTAPGLDSTVQARLECDGNLEVSIALHARKAMKLADVRLELPLVRRVAQYMMGLGLKGGLRPACHDWKWDVTTNQDCVWAGDASAGVQIMLKDANYVRPLNTNFYQQQPLVMPVSWANGGKGGIRCLELDAATFMISCYSGSRAMRAGETQFFNFRLLLTPFRPITPASHFSARYFHACTPPAEAVAAGANVINIHHATELNPYLNYPFLRSKELKAYIEEAHKLGCKVKLYYTVRELTNRAPELFALRSLGCEIFSEGPGNGYAWLQEHLGSHYIPAWFVPELKDAAIITAGGSRLHNFYVEGLDWLARNLGIDGIYLDDVAFDRTIMKRVRKILDRRRPGALIDLHSANQFNPHDGFANSAGLYLDHLPYVDRLWFGEYFDYNAKPDYWLVEVSGIPFGLMGEMLEGGGNPWRGMLYGMTCRKPWQGASDPGPLWQAWDAFGIHESRMLGYWAPSCPVATNHKDVLATVYARQNKAMIALASWAPEPVEVKLDADWHALGLSVKKMKLVAPNIENFQKAATLSPTGRIPIEPGKGCLLVASAKRK